MVDLGTNPVVKGIELIVQVLNAVPEHGNQVDWLLLFRGRLLLWRLFVFTDTLFEVSIGFINFGSDRSDLLNLRVVLLSILYCFVLFKCTSLLPQRDTVSHRGSLLLRSFYEIFRVNFVFTTVSERTALESIL